MKPDVDLMYLSVLKIWPDFAVENVQKALVHPLEKSI